MKTTAARATGKLVSAAAALSLVLTCGAAMAQQGGGGRPGGGMRGMVSGKIAQKDLKNNAVLVQTEQEQRWVQLPQGVTINKRVDVKIDEIKEKDTITVNGTPTAIDARAVELITPPAGGAANGQTAPGAPGAPGAQRGAPTVWGMVTGTVTSLDPLTITTADGVKVTVTTNQNTRVAKNLQVGVNEVALGEQFSAFGQPNDQGVVQARFAGVGQMDFGGMGGGWGGRGQRGGRRGDAPQQ